MNTRRHIKAMLALFCAMFLVLCVYLLYIINAYGTRWVSSPYNTRLTSQKNSVIAGNILDRAGTVLATTDRNGDRVYIDDGSVRRATSHVVGDSYGQTFGADTFYSKYLLGFDQSVFERVSQVFSGANRYGSHVQLTIDAKLCDYAYGLLGDYNGAVVLMNHKTGEILASVSRPDYDPKYVDEYLSGKRSLDKSAMVDRVTAGLYPPGSVFKIVTLTAALRYLPGVETRTFTCDGPLAFDTETGRYLSSVNITAEQDKQNQAEAGGSSAGLSGKYRVVRDYNGQYHGELTLKSAFMKSCNHVFAQLAMEVGADRMKKVARELGVGDDFLFSDMVAYASSYEKPETQLDLAWSGVGQYKDIMTPLHMCMIAGGVANDGVMMEPKLLKAVVAVNGTATGKLKSEAYKKPFTATEWETLKSYMIAVVESGTGRNAAISGHTVGGKTGTAEVSGRDKPNAWFVGFVADTEHPLTVCVVLEKGGSGGSNAAPIAGKVLKKAIKMGY